MYYVYLWPVKVKEITHDLNHDLTFYAHTINCVCHSIRSMFRVLWVYNFGKSVEISVTIEKRVSHVTLER